MVALLISVPLYPFFIRSMEAARKRKELTHAGKRSSCLGQFPGRCERYAMRGQREEGISL